MPDVAEPPKEVRANKPNLFQQSAIAGKSPADEFAEMPAKTPDAKQEATPEFSEALKAAQSKDKGGTSDLTPAAQPESKPQDGQPSTPKVPKLPEQQEWRPRTEKGAQQWDALKAKHAEEVGALKSELERLKGEVSKVGTSPDVEALRSEAKQLREILRDVAIERDPEFQKVYSARETAAIDAAKLAAGEHSAKLESLLKAPNSPWRDEQINDLVEKLPASSQRRINAALQVIEQIDVERTAEIARNRATFDQKQSALFESQNTKKAETEKQMNTAFDATMKQWTDPKAGHPFFIEREGDKEHNAGVKESLDLAKAIFSGQLQPEEIAAAAFWAASGERLLKGWQTAISRAEKAERALDKIRGVQPGDGQPGELNGEDDEKAPAPGSPGYLSYMKARLEEAQKRDAATKMGVR